MTRTAMGSKGFSLLELLVALAIMSIALGTLYRAVGGGVRTVGDLSGYSRAVVVGESVLQMREAVPAEGWNESGQWEDFRWSVASSLYEPAVGSAVALHRINVEVSWVDGLHEKRFSLVSLRPQESDRAKSVPR